MRKWQTIAVTALSTLALSGAGFTAYQLSQPTHYEGTTFTNEKHSTTHSTNSHMASSTTNNEQSSATVTDSSSDTTVPEQSTSVTEKSSQVFVTGRPSQPAQLGGTVDPNPTKLTFYAYPGGTAETTQGRMEVGLVVCGELQQGTIYIPMTDCYAFRDWMTSITQGKTSLDHSLQENLDYWYANVKGQQ